MSFTTVTYEKEDGVAWVTLNRPRVLNAYNVQMRDDLYEVLSAVRDDTDVRALVLRGAGRSFCSGADLTEFGTAPSPMSGRRVRFARDIWSLLWGLDIPSVAALHGHVIGAGLEMALLCDLRIAADDAHLRMPEVQLGLIPAGGGTQTLRRCCGIGPALDILLTGRTIDADEALQMQLVSEIVPRADLASRVRSLVTRLTVLPPTAVSALRRAIREGCDLPLHTGFQLEARLGAMLWESNSE